MFALFYKIHADELTLADALERREADIGPRLQKRRPEFLTPDQTQAAMDLVRDAIFGGD